MSQIYPVLLEDADGTTYTVYIESTEAIDLPNGDTANEGSDGRESYGPVEDVQARMKSIHGTIRAYTWYVIGAFKNFSRRRSRRNQPQIWHENWRQSRTAYLYRRHRRKQL
jgi:hypothetical protein